ncbi:hypothetical protein BH23ACT10_BH23ACT10_32460 [soil metagenome]
MSASPLVSVVIPAYNASTHVRTAVTSALQQTYQPIEVVVVDDGSTDATPQIVTSLAVADSRVRLIRQPNQGVAAARNRGIAASRGTYVAPLDADDYWLPDKIRSQVARIEAGGPGMGLVYCWWITVDANGRRIGTSPRWTEEGNLFRALLHTNMIGNGSLPLFRRACLDVVGTYDTSLRARGGEGCEDWDLSLRIASRYDIGVVPMFASAYRRVPRSMSTDIDKMRRSFQLVMAQVQETTPDLPGAVVRWSRASYSCYLATTAYGNGEYGHVVRLIARAVARDPLAVLWPSAMLVLCRALIRLVVPRPCAVDGPVRPSTRGTARSQPADHGRMATALRRMLAHGPYDRIHARRWRQLTADAGVAVTPTDVRPTVLASTLTRR